MLKALKRKYEQGHIHRGQMPIDPKTGLPRMANFLMHDDELYEHRPEKPTSHKWRDSTLEVVAAPFDPAPRGRSRRRNPSAPVASRHRRASEALSVEDFDDEDSNVDGKNNQDQTWKRVGAEKAIKGAIWGLEDLEEFRARNAMSDEIVEVTEDREYAESMVAQEQNSEREMDIEEDELPDSLLDYESEEEVLSGDSNEENSIDNIGEETEGLNDLNMDSENEETEEEEDISDTEYDDSAPDRPSNLKYHYTFKEMNRIFGWVEDLLKTQTIPLKRKGDFEQIAVWRNQEFEGKRIEVGELLSDGITRVKEAYYLPKRDSNALHSFCTKKTTNGNSYYHLCKNAKKLRGE